MPRIKHRANRKRTLKLELSASSGSNGDFKEAAETIPSEAIEEQSPTSSEHTPTEAEILPPPPPVASPQTKRPAQSVLSPSPTKKIKTPKVPQPPPAKAKATKFASVSERKRRSRMVAIPQLPPTPSSSTELLQAYHGGPYGPGSILEVR
ncbi:extensin-like [Momordica charantia]|uniref:Extensin-like n=1 Tax=Momordica charantia TaxID=3673 RepID=A0A6J1DKP0_MOMCH|nr:extensin-like [Momordica charantia]